MCMHSFFVFFSSRRRHTRYWRDWSSDVCSSDLFLAFWLEFHLSKDEILKLYLDRAYMGGGTFGAAAAADYYFGKSVKDLSLADRKSTRLNSSHANISYAVFCLKKKIEPAHV